MCAYHAPPPLYSLGEHPKCFLKLAEKCDGLENPVMYAMYASFSFPSSIISDARLSLYVLKNALGVSPVSAFVL